MTHATLPEGRGSTRSEATAPRIAVVGVHGYGASHVLDSLDLEGAGRARLVGLVDPVGGPVRRHGVVVAEDRLPTIHPTIEALLEAVDVDIVAVATPLHTHASIAAAALRAGADVLLEKPPVTDLRDLDDLVQLEASTGGRVQVGFQSLGSHALPALAAAIDRGALGRVTAIAVVGSWTRDVAYWTRASWAGRRTIDGVRVADGAVSNPFAHALMTALRIAGWDAPDAIDRVDFDLRSVNRIEADDTSSLRVHPSALGSQTFAGTLTCAFTLAGPREEDPYIVVTGTKGSARLDYTRDRLRIGDSPARPYGRDPLLENLIDHRRIGAALLSPLDRTGAFVRIIDQLAGEPVTTVPARFVTWEGEGSESRPVLGGVESAVRHAALQQRLFRELDGVPWAR